MSPMCPFLWQLRRLSRGLLSGSDVSLTINSRLGNSQAQTRKSTSFLRPFPPAKNGRKGKEAEGNPGDVRNNSQVLAEEDTSSMQTPLHPSLQIPPWASWQGPPLGHGTEHPQGKAEWASLPSSLACSVSASSFNAAWQLGMLA